MEEVSSTGGPRALQTRVPEHFPRPLFFGCSCHGVHRAVERRLAACDNQLDSGSSKAVIKTFQGWRLPRVFSVVMLAVALVCAYPLLADSNGPPTESKEVKSLADATLPDAPTPQAAASTTGNAIHYAPLYARTIFPGETAHRLNLREKFLYAGRQMVEPINLLPALYSGVESQYLNSDPKYGTDTDALEQRFGAAVAREDSDRLFTDAVMPALLHEDPRYYRLGESSSNVRRTVYALEQVFIARNDQGKEVPNYAGFLGRGMAVGLSMVYYPSDSRNGGAALREFGGSIEGLAAFDLLREFVPRAVFSHLTIFREPDSMSEPGRK